MNEYKFKGLWFFFFFFFFYVQFLQLTQHYWIRACSIKLKIKSFPMGKILMLYLEEVTAALLPSKVIY